MNFFIQFASKNFLKKYCIDFFNINDIHLYAVYILEFLYYFLRKLVRTIIINIILK